MSYDYGFIEWKPYSVSLKRLEIIHAVLREYVAHLPLTMRQVFYRAVGKHGYDKSEPAYERLLYTSAKGRRARLIDFAAIRDDGVTAEAPFKFDGPDDFRDYVMDVAGDYQSLRQFGQARILLVLVEAAGMVPQLGRVSKPLGVQARSCGGYDSVTEKHRLARWIARSDRPVTILHVGDLDPSGEDMFANLSLDLAAFIEDMEPWHDPDEWLEMVRVAVTREQADAMNLPTAAPKTDDKRSAKFKGRTVQCEAIPPDVLSQIVRDAIVSRLDMDVFNRNLAAEEEEREQIKAAIAELSFE